MNFLRVGWAVIDRKGRMIGDLHNTEAAAVESAEINSCLWWWWLSERRKWTCERVTVSRAIKAKRK